MKIANGILLLMALIIAVSSCKKDKYVFTMKTVKLNAFEKTDLPDQNFSIKVVDTDNQNILASTDNYPTKLTLPATLALKPHPELNLYQRDHISIQLWGDSSGFLAESTIRMKKYKIIFPIDMETEENGVSFSVMGSWK